MKIYATYGLGAALVGAVLTLVAFFTGLHGEHIQYAAPVGYLAIFVAIVAVVLGMRACRTAAAERGMTYGRGLGAGVLISLWQSVAGALFNLLYVVVINPAFNDTMIAYQMSKLEEKQLPPQALEMSEMIMHTMMTPAIQTVVAVLGGIFWGCIISLIAAAVLKRAPAPESLLEEVPPPVA